MLDKILKIVKIGITFCISDFFLYICDKIWGKGKPYRVPINLINIYETRRCFKFCNF